MHYKDTKVTEKDVSTNKMFHFQAPLALANNCCHNFVGVQLQAVEKSCSAVATCISQIKYILHCA